MFDSSPPTPAKVPLTDSPWFWLMLFSAAAVAFLLVIAPQYAPRQQRLEMQYRAREEMHRRQVVGEAAARAPGEEGDALPPGPGELIIPLWPLVLFFSSLGTASAYVLWRGRRFRNQPGPSDSEGEVR